MPGPVAAQVIERKRTPAGADRMPARPSSRRAPSFRRRNCTALPSLFS